MRLAAIELAETAAEVAEDNDDADDLQPFDERVDQLRRSAAKPGLVAREVKHSCRG